MTLNSRIQHLIDIKAGGNKSRFARMIGWPVQNMSRVTKEGGPAGMAIVEKILEVFEDVDARWLATGRGEPIDTGSPINALLHRRINEYLELAKHTKYMDPAEMEVFKHALANGESVLVSAEQLHRWGQNRENDERSKSNDK